MPTGSSDSALSGTPVPADGIVPITWTWAESLVLADFDPATDVLALDWFTGADLQLTEEGGNAVLRIPGMLQSYTLTGVSLADLSMANFTFKDASAGSYLSDTLAAADSGGMGEDGHDDGGMGDGGNDGGGTGDSGTGDGGTGDGGGDTGGGGAGDGGAIGTGDVHAVNTAAADIQGFDPATDILDFGDVSVHNLILGKTEAGEVAFVNVWAWSPEMQVLDGITFEELSIANFGTVVNEHLRQDIGGVVSWELGLGPREADTVYMRSHEYGVHERVENFDPSAMKLSFLYFGTRERLTAEDSAEGLLLSVQPSGQSILLVGVAKADLVAANLEFHHDQIVEDQLEAVFGFTVDEVTMVSRAGLLTPDAPAGEVTDGHQTSAGSENGHDHGDHGGHDDDGMGDGGMGDDGTGDGGGDTGDGGTGDGAAIGTGDVHAVNTAAADIQGFDPATDILDFGDVSVHNLILGKTEAGEVAFVNVWAWSPEMQVLDGISFDELSIANFGTVVNEHLRQDIGGVVSWELGLGPREADTVYMRSHEYGVHERVENFDPSAMKLSFLYFGTRERLTAEDSAEGLLLSVQPSGQSILLVGVAKADLVAANLEFHHDQIVEDQLEAVFGFTVDEVTMVSRAGLLTPDAPAGEVTDGHQTSAGSENGHDHGDHGGHDDDGMGDGGMGDGGTDDGGEPVPAGNVVAITWAWAESRTFDDFDPATDVLALDWFRAEDLQLVEEQGSTVLRIPGMQQSYTLAGIALAELSLANFTFMDPGAGAYLAGVLGAEGGTGTDDGGGTGDTGGGDTGGDTGGDDTGGGDTGGTDPGSGQVHAVTWSWNEHLAIGDFDIAADQLAIGWFAPEHLTLTQVGGSTVLGIPSNQQSVTLTGIALADLGPQNFTFMDPAAAAHVAAILAAADATPDAGDGGGTDGGGDTGDGGGGGGGPGGSGDGDNSFAAFLTELGDYESGVDYDRYLSGDITEAQIRGWVGDPVWESWEAGEIGWRDMSYHSVNSYGFTGRYQFGEALLIDLGYYQADTYYLNGAATNEWNGSWTGKNGVTSYDGFKSDIQETAILDAFGMNLKVIDGLLQAAGSSLDDVLGMSIPDVTWADAHTDVVTVTGLLASAHLVGAWSTAAFLLNGAESADEYGTSMRQYMSVYGGYEHPPAEDLVADYVESTSPYHWTYYPDVTFDAPDAQDALTVAALESGADGGADDPSAADSLFDDGADDPEADGHGDQHDDMAA